MSDHGSRSIWRDDQALDSWYNAAVNDNAAFRTEQDTDMDEKLLYDIGKSNQGKYPSGPTNDWFYDTVGDHATIDAAKSCVQQYGGGSQSPSVLGLGNPTSVSGKVTLDKPLPPIPGSPASVEQIENVTPYFDYMFADAGVESHVHHVKYSPDNLSFEVDNDVAEHDMSCVDDNAQASIDDMNFVDDSTQASIDDMNFVDDSTQASIDDMDFEVDSDAELDMSFADATTQAYNDNVSFEIDNYVFADDITQAYHVPSPDYNPLSPGYNALSPAYNATSPDYNALSPDYNALSPAYNAPSPEDGMPETPEYRNDTDTFHVFEDAGFTTHAFLEAGISITSKELADSYRGAAGPNGVSHFVLNEADEAEKEAATAGFYGGFSVEETPSPYHAPVLDQAEGFGDTRDGAEEFPEQWQQIHEQQPKAYTIEEVNAMMQDCPMDTTNVAIKPVLMPTARKIAAAKHRSGRVPSAMVIDLTADDSSQDESNSTGKKRKAQDSFTTRSFFDTSSSDDDDVQYLYTKKLRVKSNDRYDAEVEMIPRTPAYSLITIPDEENEPASPKSDTASAIFAKIEPAPVGYPGQFCSVKSLEQAMRDHPDFALPSILDRVKTMGDVLHSNYLFTHYNFYPCKDEDKTEYASCSARRGGQVWRSLEYADEQTLIAANTPRKAAEELLRREVHRECASARLEGVSVGEFRFYGGHLSLEEYKEAGMCICWEVCECAKPCTRFADMVCPCSEHITIHKKWRRRKTKTKMKTKKWRPGSQPSNWLGT